MTDMRSRSPENGFSLIELILYLAIASLITLALTSFLSVMFEARVKNRTIAEVEQQAAHVMQVFTQAARQAASVTTPGSGSTDSSIELEMPDAGVNPTLFDLSAGAIRIEEGGGSAVALTSSDVDVSSLTFRNLSRTDTPGVVQIEFTMNHANPSGRQAFTYTKTFTTSASLRF